MEHRMDFSKLNQRPCIPRNMAVYHGGTSSMAYMRSLEALLLFEMMKLEIVLNSRYNMYVISSLGLLSCLDLSVPEVPLSFPFLILRSTSSSLSGCKRTELKLKYLIFSQMGF